MTTVLTLSREMATDANGEFRQPSMGGILDGKLPFLIPSYAATKSVAPAVVNNGKIPFDKELGLWPATVRPTGTVGRSCQFVLGMRQSLAPPAYIFTMEWWDAVGDPQNWYLCHTVDSEYGNQIEVNGGMGLHRLTLVPAIIGTLSSTDVVKFDLYSSDMVLEAEMGETTLAAEWLINYTFEYFSGVKTVRVTINGSLIYDQFIYYSPA